ncbi:TPA: hypothetical protein ACN306_004757, partial [Vibrio parahaemolyticus]
AKEIKMKVLSIIESVLQARAKRREEARAGRIKDDFVEDEFQETLQAAKKSEPKTYEKYKDK